MIGGQGLLVNACRMIIIGNEAPAFQMMEIKCPVISIQDIIEFILDLH